MTYEEQANRIKALEKENQALREKIAELERRLGLNSKNSSKPPSTDGLKKEKRTKSLRKSSGKKSGGQKGHQGYTLEMVNQPEKIIRHEPLNQYCQCGCNLTGVEEERVIKRQVFDLPVLKMEVTEHQVVVKKCPNCHQRHQGEFPEKVKAPVQYGEKTRALSAYLHNQHFIPEQRLSELLSDVFGCQMSNKTIANINGELAHKSEPTVEKIRGKVLRDDVKHADETGMRIKGKTHWLHSLSTEKLTWYRVSETRKDNEPLLSIEGTVVHDHWKPYYQLDGVKHSLCNAHHLRELKAISEIEGESWAKSLTNLLLLGNQYKQRYEGQIPHEVKLRLRRIYDSIVARGIEYHQSLPPLAQKSQRGRKKRRVGHNLLLRLRDYANDTLRFLDSPDIPFTNNQAERDIRMMKCRQKISGGFRSWQGAENFATIRSLISTARKQGRNILEVLIQVLNGDVLVFS
jgi:transposase